MQEISYDGYRFPPEIIHQAIWLYLRFTLSFRDVEDLLAERGIAVSYETVRRWVKLLIKAAGDKKSIEDAEAQLRIALKAEGLI